MKPEELDNWTDYDLSHQEAFDRAMDRREDEPPVLDWTIPLFLTGALLAFVGGVLVGAAYYVAR